MPTMSEIRIFAHILLALSSMAEVGMFTSLTTFKTGVAPILGTETSLYLFYKCISDVIAECVSKYAFRDLISHIEIAWVDEPKNTNNEFVTCVSAS